NGRRCGLCDLRIATLDHLFEGGPIELLLDPRGGERVGHIEVAATKSLELLHHGLHRLLRRGTTSLRPRRDHKKNEQQRADSPSTLQVAAILYRRLRWKNRRVGWGALPVDHAEPRSCAESLTCHEIDAPVFDSTQKIRVYGESPPPHPALR